MNEQERIAEWKSRLRAIWVARPDISHFIEHVAFSLTLRDIDIAEYRQRDIDAFKEQRGLTKVG